MNQAALASKTSAPIAREHDHGDFVVRMSYVDPNPQEVGSDWEPAMVIARKRRYQNRSAHIIMLSAAYKYVSESEHRHSDYMHDMAPRISEMLGLGRSPITAFKIAEAIHSHLEELINMPPAFRPQTVVGHASGTIGDLKIESEVMG